MYSVWLSTRENYPLGKCVYDNSIAEPAMTFIDPVLNLKAGAAGEFEFSIAPTQLYYDSFTKLTSIITIVRDGKIIWEGRIIDEEMDFYKTKKFVCEGALAYFNDTVQYPSETGTDLRVFLAEVIARHNIQSGSDKHKIFKLGYISQDVIPEDNFKTDYESTLEVLNSIVDTYKGYFTITWNENGEKVLGYFSEKDIEIIPTVAQTIEFGKNLLDYAHSYDVTELCTVIIPIGGRVKVGEGWAIRIKDTEDYILDENNEVLLFEKKTDATTYIKNEGLDTEYYETVKLNGEEVTVNISGLGDISNDIGDIKHVGGTPYLYSESAVATYGWICKKVDFNDITDPIVLYYLGVAYLQKGQFENLKIDITAFDMAMLSPKIDGLPVKPKEE